MRTLSRTKKEQAPETEALATAATAAPEPAPPPKVREVLIPATPMQSATYGEHRLRPGMERMVTIAFPQDDEIPKLYETAVEWLRSAEVGQSAAAMSQGEYIWHQLTRATIAAKVEVVRWEAENAVVFGAIRQEAVNILEAEKASGARTKAYFEKDIEHVMATRFADAHSEQAVGRARVEQTVKLLEAMHDQMSSRCRALQTAVNKGR